LPGIRCPIPDDPERIIAARTTGDYFKDLKAQMESFNRAARGEAPSKDGMMYAQETLGRLAELAKMVVAVSPIAPKPIHIPSEEIVELKIEREP
jgi:hypothetical protein